MKCNKCNKNEATVFFTQSVNGNETKAYLCSECAEELGIMKKLTIPAFSTFGKSFFDTGFGTAFDEFFNIFDGFSRGFCLPASPFSSTEERPLQKLVRTPQNPEKSRNELQALKKELKAAVKSENYERAAELRDRIRKLEAARDNKNM